MNQQKLVFYIGVASSGLCLIPFAVSLLNLKKINFYLKPVFGLLAINVVFEIMNIFFARSGLSNNYILHYFTVAEFALISLFYRFFFKKYFNPLLIDLIIPVFLIAAYIDYRIYGLNSAYNFSPSVECIVIIFYSFFFFYYTLKKLIFENLLATPVFWINTAILFYFSGNLILFIFSSYMAKIDIIKYGILWAIIHTFFNLLYNFLLSVGFWKTKNK